MEPRTAFESDWAKFRSLEHPLRRKILEEARKEACTAASLAEALAVPQTRLYRHLDALTSAGWLEIIEERPKRGTIERVYRGKGAELDKGAIELVMEGGNRAALRLNVSVAPADVEDLLRAIADLAGEYETQGESALTMTVTLEQAP